MRTEDDAVLMRVADVHKSFPLKRGPFRRPRMLRAVDGVSFDVRHGETLGIVGESGSGKTTVGRLLLRLERPTSGQVTYCGMDLWAMSPREVLAYRRDVQMIFQDPYGTLNPRMTVGRIVAEPWKIFDDLVPKAERRERAAELLERVGLRREHLDRHPASFSGGQRQRINIARALALRPRILVCDEPVSALDVSIQAQILNLLADVQAETGIALVFISHDLGVVRQVSRHIAVMYLGKIMEFGDTEQIYASPTHPYTQSLLSAVPKIDAFAATHPERIPLTGEMPSAVDPPSGCNFRTRCWKAEPRCAEEEPALVDRGHGRPSACHFAEVLDPTGRR